LVTWLQRAFLVYYHDRTWLDVFCAEHVEILGTILTVAENNITLVNEKAPVIDHYATIDRRRRDGIVGRIRAVVYHKRPIKDTSEGRTPGIESKVVVAKDIETVASVARGNAPGATMAGGAGIRAAVTEAADACLRPIALHADARITVLSAEDPGRTGNGSDSKDPIASRRLSRTRCPAQLGGSHCDSPMRIGCKRVYGQYSIGILTGKTFNSVSPVAGGADACAAVTEAADACLRPIALHADARITVLSAEDPGRTGATR
jgi:hypothetical protein